MRVWSCRTCAHLNEVGYVICVCGSRRENEAIKDTEENQSQTVGILSVPDDIPF